MSKFIEQSISSTNVLSLIGTRLWFQCFYVWKRKNVWTYFLCVNRRRTRRSRRDTKGSNKREANKSLREKSRYHSKTRRYTRVRDPLSFSTEVSKPNAATPRRAVKEESGVLRNMQKREWEKNVCRHVLLEFRNSVIMARTPWSARTTRHLQSAKSQNW